MPGSRVRGAYTCAVSISEAQHMLCVSVQPCCAQQQEDAVERERCAAAARLCEASERREAQLQASRMRLAADNDIKVGLVRFPSPSLPPSLPS